MATSVDAINISSDQIHPDTMFVNRKSEYNVKIESDKRHTCYISGICILPSGETIVADYNNKRVKMLNMFYNVSSDLEVDSNPKDICLTSPCTVAVTFDKSVQFIKVNNGKLVTGYPRAFGNEDYSAINLALQHAALGITYHQGDLYITSGTALYHYSFPWGKWQLNQSLYEDNGGGITVNKCAFSPDGDFIYVTNFAQNKLITLAIDGTLLSSFTDPELVGPKGLHVTPTGKVLVCGISSHTVIHVDRGGRKKVTTLASEEDGLPYPVSICYNDKTCDIIVGAYANNKIRVINSI